MSRRENAAEGARGADASNTCSHCKRGISNITHSRDDDDSGHTFHYGEGNSLQGITFDSADPVSSTLLCHKCGSEELRQQKRDAEDEARDAERDNVRTQ